VLDGWRRDDWFYKSVPYGSISFANVAAAMNGRTKWLAGASVFSQGAFADFAHFNDEGAGVIAQCIASTVERARIPRPAIEFSAAR